MANDANYQLDSTAMQGEKYVLQESGVGGGKKRVKWGKFWPERNCTKEEGWKATFFFVGDQNVKRTIKMSERMNFFTLQSLYEI